MKRHNSWYLSSFDTRYRQSPALTDHRRLSCVLHQWINRHRCRQLVPCNSLSQSLYPYYLQKLSQTPSFPEVRHPDTAQFRICRQRRSKNMHRFPGKVHHTLPVISYRCNQSDVQNIYCPRICEWYLLLLLPLAGYLNSRWHKPHFLHWHP